MDKDDQKHEPLRRRRYTMNRKKKLDRILNYLIAFVSILIVFSAFIILTNGTNEQQQKQTQSSESSSSNAGDLNVKEKEDNKVQVTNNEKPSPEKREHGSTTENIDAIPETGTEVTETPSNDAMVDRVIVNQAWKPTPTSQSGAHISSYDEKSIDWQEKITTFLLTANLEEDQAIIWSVKNNGGPQSAIGVISSKDKSQKYRIQINWVEKGGWKPVKMEILNTLEGAY